MNHNHERPEMELSPIKTFEDIESVKGIVKQKSYIVASNNYAELSSPDCVEELGILLLESIDEDSKYPFICSDGHSYQFIRRISHLNYKPYNFKERAYLLYGRYFINKTTDEIQKVERISFCGNEWFLESSLGGIYTEDRFLVECKWEKRYENSTICGERV